MTLLERVSRDLVAACWLKAELFSPRFRPRVIAALKRCGLSSRVIQRPVLTSVRENRLRRQVLRFHRRDLWGALSHRTEWWRAVIPPQEFRRLRVINYPTWTLLSRDTGRLSTAATVIARGTVPARATGRWAHEARAVITNVLQIRDRLPEVEIHNQLILMGRPTGRLWTILEGNKRATALYIGHFLAKTAPLPPAIRVLIGLTEERCACLRLK
ncbi:MAG: hypothetical protein L0Y78_03990 [candidate division NC10 bacterium]|nr:hypothetical protein [candidate division NC10 bacterium]